MRTGLCFGLGIHASLKRRSDRQERGRIRPLIFSFLEASIEDVCTLNGEEGLPNFEGKLSNGNDKGIQNPKNIADIICTRAPTFLQAYKEDVCTISRITNKAKNCTRAGRIRKHVQNFERPILLTPSLLSLSHRRVPCLSLTGRGPRRHIKMTSATAATSAPLLS